jgi:hypothetical protein
MLDLFSSSDLWIKVLAFLTSIVALITAVITLKKSRPEKSEVAADSPVKLRSFRAIERSRIWSHVLTAIIIVSGLFTAVGISAAIFELYMSTQDSSDASPVFFLIAALGICVVLYIALLKRRLRGSVPSKEATVTVQGNQEQVLDACIAASRKLKIRLTAIDAKQGMIEGRTPRNWRSLGEIIDIRVAQTEPTECTVHIKSRCSQVGVLIDWGKNASNINRFSEELIH